MECVTKVTSTCNLPPPKVNEKPPEEEVVLGKKEDSVLGATQDFINNYRNMREANTIGADKYFHCKAICQASQRGETGRATAELISDAREFTDQKLKGDPESASEADQEANKFGRHQGKYAPNKSCGDLCGKYRPNGLDPRY